MEDDIIVMKGACSPVINKKGEWNGEFASSDPTKPSIKINSICIRSDSDEFDSNEDHVGLIVYLHKGQSQFNFNGKLFQTGDIFIKQSKKIEEKTKHFTPPETPWHEKLFYCIFGNREEKILDFVCGGFSYHEGEWKYRSGTLNTTNPTNNDDTYHDDKRELNKFEGKLIRKVHDYLYTNGKWLSMPFNIRIPLQIVEDMENIDRCHRGTVKPFSYYRGYGFIQCSYFKKDIFVHYSAIRIHSNSWPYLKRNQNVEFNVDITDKGWIAVHVVRVSSP